jgi:hypothetical protein
MIDDCRALVGMKNDKENRSIWRKSVSVPPRPPQILHDLRCCRTQAAALVSRRQAEVV